MRMTMKELTHWLPMLTLPLLSLQDACMVVTALFEKVFVEGSGIPPSNVNSGTFVTVDSSSIYRRRMWEFWSQKYLNFDWQCLKLK